MAVCEIWDVRGRLDHPLNYVKNPDKTANPQYNAQQMQSLTDMMQYAVNDAKTEYQFYVSGVNCDPSTARQEMQSVKRQFDDHSKIVCYHAYQSFAKGEVTPQQAHEIGVQLAERMWGERFQVVVATHLNTDCCHNHFVINSVSFADGKHYYDNKANLRLLRQTSDELCREHNLSVIKKPDGRKKPYAMHKAEQNGIPTRNDIARRVIDEAISKSYTLHDFDRHLAEMGFECSFDPNHKYWTIKGKEWGRPKRMHKLGAEYTNERIMERIAQNGYTVLFSDFAPERVSFKTYRVKGIVWRKPKHNRHKSLRNLYLYYCYRMGLLPKKKKTNPARMHYLLRDDLMKLDAITAETRLLCKYQIDTAEQFFSFLESRRTEAKQLAGKRKKLRTQLRKLPDGEEKEEIKQEITQISDRLRTIRKEVRRCEQITERSSILREKLTAIQQEEQQRKELKNHADRRRSGRSDRQDELGRS